MLMLALSEVLMAFAVMLAPLLEISIDFAPYGIWQRRVVGAKS